MLYIPIQPVPAQTLTVSLGGQPCRINIYQRATGLFVDLYVNDAQLVVGVICRNGEMIVRDEYFGFSGDLMFLDQRGDDDPNYTGLGSRWVLAYMEAWQFVA